ncbi:class I SAM-dependent methyltransferase [Microbacteriaceae bacterium 4G12]
MITIIKEAIEKSHKKAISYSTYMDLALYHPVHGYYMKERAKIGRDGDFFTSSNVSSVYAKQFAQFFIDLVEAKVVPPLVCEIGGGTGRFARDVLEEWKEHSPHTFSKLRYYLVETSPFHRAVQKSLLEQFSNVSQCVSIHDIGDSFQGIVFSNELFDAFPVHVIEKHNEKLYEVYVTFDDQDRLVEALYPLQNEIVTYLHKHKLQLKEGQRFEVPLAMNKYMKELCTWLDKGMFITVDYGYTNEEWMREEHREGSLRGYYAHQLIRNPLQHPGNMDLTTHIHWDALKMAGEEGKLQTVLQTKQRYFLLASGILERLVDHNDTNPFSEKNKTNRAIRSMILNGGISDSFDVLIQQKGLLNFSIENYINLSFLPHNPLSFS